MTRPNERHEIIEEFAKSNAGNENTLNLYRKRLVRFFRDLKIDNPNDYFESNRDYLEDYKTFASGIKNLAPRTQVVYLNTVKVFFEDNKVVLPRKELKKVNVVNQIRLAKTIVDSRTPNRPELKMLLTLADLKIKTLIMFLASTGMRVGEALEIELGDIDWHNRSVRVRREVAKGGYPRTTFFTPETEELLKQWIDTERKKFIVTGYKKSQYVRKELESQGFKMKEIITPYTAIHKDGKKVESFQRHWKAYRNGKKVTREELIEYEKRLFPFTYSTAGNIWDNLVEKAGSPFNQRDGRYLMYNVHCLRRFWKTEFKVPSEFQDEKDFMMGHISGLDSRYFKPDFNRLKKVYDENMKTITLFSDADRVKSELQPTIDVQTKQLQELMLKNDKLENELDEMLKLMYYSTGEPPITKEQKRIREAFKEKLESRLGKGMA